MRMMRFGLLLALALPVHAAHAGGPIESADASVPIPAALSSDGYIDAGDYACENFDRQVDAFRTAMVDGDGETLMKLAADHLSFGHSNGLVQTREEFVESVVSRSEVFNSIELTERRSDCDGRIGIERHMFDADILLAGSPLQVKLSVLEVWHNDGLEWKLVARQAFAL